MNTALQPFGDAILALVMACQVNTANLDVTPKDVLTAQTSCTRKVMQCYGTILKSNGYDTHTAMRGAVKCLRSVTP